MISPGNKVTKPLAHLVRENRVAVAEYLRVFGRLNEVGPDARGMSYRQWLQSRSLDELRDPSGEPI